MGKIKLYLILLLMTYLLYPKMICACFHAGTLCHPSLPPFFSILLTLGFVEIITLGLSDPVSAYFAPIFVFNILVYFLAPALAIKINGYLRARNKIFFKGNGRKDFYLNMIAAWIIAICVFLIIDLILSMSGLKLCYVIE